MLTNTRRRKELHEQELDEYYAQLKFIVIGEMQDALRRLFGKKLKRRWLIFDTAMGCVDIEIQDRKGSSYVINADQVWRRDITHTWLSTKEYCRCRDLMIKAQQLINEYEDIVQNNFNVRIELQF
jgi:hypothetical protein